MNPMSKARGSLTGAVAMLTLGVGWCMVQMPILQDKADAASVKAGRLEPQVTTLSANQQKLLKGLDEANRRLVALGKPPVAVPTVTPTQPTGLTAEQTAAVRSIVADQLSSQKVTITQAEISQIARVAAQMVPKPADGKTPTAAQLQPIVTAAIAAYCTGDKCVKVGATGPQGERGPKGDDAPKVTDEELLKAAQQALASYCAGDSKPCDGKNGSDGQDAPIVVDVDCEGATGLKFTFNFDRNHGPITAECKP